MSIDRQGDLFIVATPIGNLDDMTQRAVTILNQVDAIAAEDTRHSKVLMNQFGIKTRLEAFHRHNEQKKGEGLINRLLSGENIALISDAGTPLISDPGYFLVGMALKSGIKVIPIPGASALTTALSVSGLETDRFQFEGFLPAKGSARRKRLKELQRLSHTLILYEAPHRILETFIDLEEIFGSIRQATLARELTKHFETILTGTLNELIAILNSDANQCRGEMVIMIAGAEPEQIEGLDPESQRVASLLAEQLPVKQAAALTSEISGGKKRDIYQYLIRGKT